MNFVLKFLGLLLLSLISLRAEGWQAEASAGLWSGSSDGTIVHNGNLELFGPIAPDVILTDHLGDHKDKTAGYLNITLKHPIPIVPNVRFEYVGVKSAGNIVYTEEVPFLGTTSATAESQLFLTQYDTVLFYNLLDNTFWTTLDLGVDMKYAQTQYYVPDLSVDVTSDSIIPMAYVHGRVEAPFAPVGLESDIKYITDGESTVYDIRIKMDYTFKMNTALEPGLELGYRIQTFTVYGEESNYLGDVFSGKSDTDVTFSGFYGGLTVKF